MKHLGQLSEIFWEGMESFLEARQLLQLSDIESSFFSEKAELYECAIKNKCEVLDNFTGFIDGTVIAIPNCIPDCHGRVEGRCRK